MVYVESLLWV